MLVPSQHHNKPLLARPASPRGVSIDEVLETAQAHLSPEGSARVDHSTRPAPSRKPSRIGLQQVEHRQRTPGAVAMKHPVTIEYASPGLKPPVYIFTDLSEPQWEAVEMKAAQDLHGVYRFIQEFQVEAGEYQYKFRLGPGEWWALDPAKPTVDDGLGNKNNSIVVNESAHVAPPEKTTEHAEHVPAPHVKQANHEDQLSEKTASSKNFGHEISPPNDHTAAPLMKHEMHDGQQSTETVATDIEPRPTEHKTTAQQSLSDTSSGAPLMKHESTFPEHAKDHLNHVDSHDVHFAPSRVSEDVSPLLQHEVATAQPHQNVSNTRDDVLDDDYDGDDDSEDEGPPLLSHERTTSSSPGEPHSPLSRHTSHSSGNLAMSLAASSPRAAMQVEPKIATHMLPINLDDPSLERFPTDEKGILEHIRRTSINLAQDETTAESLSPVSTKNLASVIEEAHDVDDDDDDDAGAEQLRDISEREATFETEPENIDPDVISPDDGGPTNPMITPMTPQELESEVEELEQEESVVQDVQQIDEDEAEEQQELLELERRAERTWWQKALDAVAHPITWVAMVGFAVVLTTGYSKLRSGDSVVSGPRK
nr:hypothetical protein CFP56_53329 [Quercus suber]